MFFRILSATRFGLCVLRVCTFPATFFSYIRAKRSTHTTRITHTQNAKQINYFDYNERDVILTQWLWNRIKRSYTTACHINFHTQKRTNRWKEAAEQWQRKKKSMSEWERGKRKGKKNHVKVNRRQYKHADLNRQPDARKKVEWMVYKNVNNRYCCSRHRSPKLWPDSMLNAHT